jgi:peptidoglycan/xylan/chitin deacetylase (PgdA/CDA1 family)
LVAGILEKHNWRGHFFVTTNFVGEAGFLDEDQIRDLHKRGHVIGSHSCSHPAWISKCTREELAREWGASVARLSDIVGTKVRCASVPGGFYSRAVAETAAAAGVEVLFTSEPTTRVHRVGNCVIVGRYAMERLSPQSALDLAAGAVRPRLKQSILWQVKKAAKALGGRYWLEARNAVISRRARKN